MSDERAKTCPECGLPGIECNAVALARSGVNTYLCQNGYSAFDARERSRALIPDTKVGYKPYEPYDLATAKPFNPKSVTACWIERPDPCLAGEAS